MFLSRQVSRVLVLVVLLFAGAAILLAMRISERQEILSQASRYNLVWLVTQTTNEIARFGSEVGAYVAEPSPQTASLLASASRFWQAVRLKSTVAT
ncbi:hypothetical protein ACFQY9_17010 [Microvirga aerilata]|uniref:hypothetical protein n=1 Tax=Microvirga aerilata TaxID=670292 RepID=UPI00362CA9FC